MEITNAQITLVVDGEKKTFSEDELIRIVKAYSEQERVNSKNEERPIQRPMEGVPFEVNPLEIDRSLFQKRRKNGLQEWTRLRILRAFSFVDKEPEKYGKPFQTLVVKKLWEAEPAYELEKLTTYMGDHMTDMVEQWLEWAQRIQNGETWRELCNESDTAIYPRLIMGIEPCAEMMMVGSGYNEIGIKYPPTHLREVRRSQMLYNVVPSVVRYD